MVVLLAACVVGAEELRTTLDEQEAVSVTVYNAGLGLVRDTRRLQLPVSDELRLQFMDVASRIIPTSVHIRSVTAPEALEVLEQNYEYDLLSPHKLMEKYVGRPVKLIRHNEYTDRTEVKEGTLLSTNQGYIYRFGDEIYINPEGQVVLPEIPPNLIAKPTLVWLLKNRRAAPQLIEATYLTEGIRWEADYVLVLSELGAGSRAALTCWVTVDNQSGAQYRNATLKLVAGEIHRAVPRERRRDMVLKAMGAAEEVSQFEERAFFEYHIYSLKRPTTIKDKQTKQVLFHETDRVAVERLLRYTGGTGYWYARWRQPVTNERPVVLVKFMNSEDSGLGIPLPEGTVRVYMKDIDGTAQFVGEDRIKHTPRDEKVELEVGKAFDVVVERRQTDWRKIGGDVFQIEWEITFRNHKDEAVEIEVLESVPGDWMVLKASHEYEKYTANTLRFIVPVEANGTAVLRYRVQFTR